MFQVVLFFSDIIIHKVVYRRIWGVVGHFYYCISGNLLPSLSVKNVLKISYHLAKLETKIEWFHFFRILV